MFANINDRPQVTKTPLDQEGRVETPVSYKLIKFSNIHLLVTALSVVAANWIEVL